MTSKFTNLKKPLLAAAITTVAAVGVIGSSFIPHSTETATNTVSSDNNNVVKPKLMQLGK